MHSEAYSQYQQSPDSIKVQLTISTLEGDYTDSFSSHEKLRAIVEQTIAHLKIDEDGPWILEYKGSDLSLDQTIEQAKLESGAILTLCPEESGGASAGQ